MSEVLQTNIFFYITSGAVVLVTIILIILLVYVIAILKNFKKISATVNRELESISKDLYAARDSIKQEGKKVFSLWNLLSSKFSPPRKTKKNSKK